MEEDRKTAYMKKVDRVWFVSLVFICLFGVTADFYYGFIEARVSPFSPERDYLGEILLGSVLIMIILIYKKRIGIFLIAVFLSVSLAIIFGEMLGMDSRAASEALAIEAQKKAAALEKKHNEALKSREQDAVFQQYLYGIFDTSFEIQRRFLNDLDDARWSAIADPERLSKDKELLETNEIVEKGKSIFRDCERKFIWMLDDNRKWGQADVLADDKKIKARAFWDELVRRTSTRVAQEKKIRDEIVAEMDSMRSLLLKREKWHIQDGEIVFDYVDDLAALNAHKKKVQDFIHKEVELQEEIMNWGLEFKKAMEQKK
ncbi:hypothetical protein ACO0K9_11465 [Undibacterium sp. Ji50W]|uniref:hypothetical protein n=1 Tax=Undibacterium sp. Ji50W TaxID=3413041 RepID=UPI003BEF7A1A